MSQMGICHEKGDFFALHPSSPLLTRNVEHSARKYAALWQNNIKHLLSSGNEQQKTQQQCCFPDAMTDKCKSLSTMITTYKVDMLEIY